MQLPAVLEQVCEICDRHGLKLANVFHAGDGNLHPNICFDRRNPDELARVMAAGKEILEACVAVGGVITGEHGIGVEKRDYMQLVFGAADLDAMRRLRDTFNPDGVCNPGKIIPTTRFCVESNPKARGYDAVPARMSQGAGRSPIAEHERIEVPGASVERVHRPAQIPELAALLADQHAKGEGVLVCGGRTRLAFANRARSLSSAIALDALSGIDVFEPDEGVVHARAGTPIRALRDAVAAEGWELPLDPPGAASTVGGAIASAAMGPRCHAFGRVADAVLGLELVAARRHGLEMRRPRRQERDGLRPGEALHGLLRIARRRDRRVAAAAAAAGASRGARGPRRVRPRTRFERARGHARAASARAFVWSESPGASEAEIVIELGSSEEGVRHDREPLERALLARARGARCDRSAPRRAGAGGEPRADRHPRAGSRDAPRRDAAELPRARASPSRSISASASSRRARRAPASRRSRRRARACLREQAIACGGHASFEWLPAVGYEGLDVFGEIPGTRGLAAALKQRFDPRSILNPGRFVAGT